jgi:hypothetical protein
MDTPVHYYGVGSSMVFGTTRRSPTFWFDRPKITHFKTRLTADSLEEGVEEPDRERVARPIQVAGRGPRDGALGQAPVNGGLHALDVAAQVEIESKV